MQELVVLYQEMATLTKPKCGECQIPNSCCSVEYCNVAADYAKKEFGVDLHTTGKGKIPFLDEKGNCTVPPYLRPLCTLHVCSINSWGVDKDIAWTKKYFRLREKIEDLELQKLCQDDRKR